MERNLFGYLCLFVTLSIAKSVIVRRSSSGDIEEIFVERHDPLQLCPTRSAIRGRTSHTVCGDVFEFNRKLRGGGTRRERRHVQNCICPNMVNETVTCDYSSRFMVRQSVIQQEALCVPVRSLPRCLPGQTARRMHFEDEDSDRPTFVDITCTCPRHFGDTLVRRQKATRYSSREFTGNNFSEVHKFECVFPGRRRGRGRGRQRGRRRFRTRQNRRQ